MLTPVSTPGPGSIIAPPPGTIQTGFNAPFNPTSLIAAQNLVQSLNPCGPISIPGGPGTSSPPLWITPPGDQYIIEGDTSTSTTTTTGAGSAGGSPSGFSLDDLYAYKFPWWVIVLIIVILIFFSDDK